MKQQPHWFHGLRNFNSIPILKATEELVTHNDIALIHCFHAIKSLTVMNHITQFDFQQPVRVTESIMTIFHFRTQVKSNVGNKSRSWGIARPKFWKWPTNFTLWSDTMTKHVTSTSWVISLKVMVSGRICKLSVQKKDLTGPMSCE